MAEGWARHLKADVIEPYSAGIERHGMNPHAVRVMAEAGVDISRQRSKTVDELGDLVPDYVITVCGHASGHCPVFPGKAKVIHVGFDDPPELTKNMPEAEEKLAVYRRVRDEIRTFVEALPGAVLASETEQMARDAGLGQIVMASKSGYVDGMVDWQDPLYQKIMAELPPGAKPSDYITSLEVKARKT